MTDQIVITEKTSQEKDIRAAVGSRYGDILPAEGHLFDLLEPEDVVPAWKRWSPILLRPEGLYGTRPAEGGNKAAKLKVIREALRSAKRVWLATDCDRAGSAHRPGNPRALSVPWPYHAGAVPGLRTVRRASRFAHRLGGQYRRSSALCRRCRRRYLEAYVQIAPRLGAEWIVMHAGFHFTSDKERRMAAGLERLKRIVGHAERHGALVLLENLNKEPDEAEIHYLAHTIEEWRYYFDAIQSPAFKLSFTVNHAHLVPEGIAGFVEAIDMNRVEEVRLADCFRNGHEVHLKPGAGDIDFADMFRQIEGKGFKGHYTNAFGSL